MILTFSSGFRTWGLQEKRELLQDGTWKSFCSSGFGNAKVTMEMIDRVTQTKRVGLGDFFLSTLWQSTALQTTGMRNNATRESTRRNLLILPIGGQLSPPPLQNGNDFWNHLPTRMTSYSVQIWDNGSVVKA